MQADARSIPRLSLAASAFSLRYWRFVVIAMLALLHLVALRGVSDDGARVLLFAHLGLLLLWQPFLRSEQSVTPAQALVIALFAVCMVFWLNWWLLAAWTKRHRLWREGTSSSATALPATASTPRGAARSRRR